jgi:hypothetical protein
MYAHGEHCSSLTRMLVFFVISFTVCPGMKVFVQWALPNNVRVSNISNTHPSPPYRMSWSNYPLCPRNPPPPPPILSLKPIVIFRNSWFSVPRIYLLMAVKVKLKPHNGMIFLGPVFVSVEIVPQGCFTGRQRIRGEATSRVLELSLDKYG